VTHQRPCAENETVSIGSVQTQYNGISVSSIPPLLLSLMFLNLTAHMALSGGRVAGSIFALKSGSSELTVGILLALYAFLPVLTALRVGRWVDSAGAYKAARVGVGCVLMGTVLPFIWLHTTALFASAAFVGYGYNVVSIALQNSVGRINADTAPEKRLANFGWFAMSHSASSTIGPFIAGLLIDGFGYRVAFGMLMISSLIALGLTIRLASEFPLPALEHDRGEGSSMRERLGVLLATPEMRRIYGVSMALSIVWDLFLVLLPVLGNRLHFSASVIGSVFALFALGTFAVRFLTAWLAQHFREWEILRAALIVIVVTLIALPFVNSPLTFMAAGFALGAALGCGQPNMLSLLHACAPDGRSGEAVGLRSLLGNASSVSIPVAFGATVALLGIGPIMFASALMIAGAVPAAHRGVHFNAGRQSE
jgi:MFS family permease